MDFTDFSVNPHLQKALLADLFKEFAVVAFPPFDDRRKNKHFCSLVIG